MSVFVKLLCNNSVKRSNVISTTIKCCSTQTTTSNPFEYASDPSSKFLDPTTQRLLKSMTRLDLSKIYRKRAVPRPTIEYKFMTTEQIEDEIKQSIRRAYSLLQMPPIVPIKQDEHKILSKDPALKAFDDANYVFTDITYGLNDAERKMVVRDPEGVLENAGPDVRKRINSIYFPLKGRNFRTPHMFEPEHLKNCLTQNQHEYILDRACVQFEPYEKDFHRITSTVYLHLNGTKEFELLRSTRHFGPLAFFLAWHKMIDDLLIDMIQRDYLCNGVELIALYYQLHNVEYDENILRQLNELDDVAKSEQGQIVRSGGSSVQDDLDQKVGRTSAQLKIDNICLDFIEKYAKNVAVQKSTIEASVQNYRLAHEERVRLSEGLHKAHGLS